MTIGAAEEFEVTDVRMFTIDSSGTILGEYNRTHSDRVGFAKDIKGGNRYITVYGLQATGNNNRKAIMFKPLGIDMVKTDYIDFSTYNLEIIST